jgi:uncharacterized integral membrane protein
MSKFVRLLKWILKAAVFFVLLAFALNNQQDAIVNLLFGRQWHAPMTLVVLAAFALGIVVGVLGMLPGWWSRRRVQSATAAVAEAQSNLAPLNDAPNPLLPPHGV